MNEFEKLMKREGLEKLIEKPREVYIARFRLYESDEVMFTEEFDTKEERDLWYESFGKWLEQEEGGRVEFDMSSPGSST